MKKYIPYLVIFLVGIVIGMWLCRQYHFRDATKMFQRDTIVVRDTHVFEKPVLVERTIKDSLLVAIHDTIRIHDTLYMSLPNETKVYWEDEYYAEVSGYKPSLDYLEIFPKTKIVTEKVTLDRTCNFLSIGIETSYMNALSTPIYLEYERKLHKNVGFYVQVAYDLPTKQYGAGIGVKAQIEW